MEKIAVSVSVHEKDPKRFPEVVKACEKVGLKPEGTLDAAGVVTGSIDAGKSMTYAVFRVWRTSRGRVA
jgi:hypothetical protein